MDSSRRWLLVAALFIGVAGIVISNFVGADGTLSGAGSSVASKVSFSIGALSLIAFVGLGAATFGSRLFGRR